MYSTKSMADYSISSPLFLEEPLPEFLSLIGLGFAAGSFLGGIYSLFPDFKIRVCSRVCPPKPEGLIE